MKATLEQIENIKAAIARYQEAAKIAAEQQIYVRGVQRRVLEEIPCYKGGQRVYDIDEIVCIEADFYTVIFDRLLEIYTADGYSIEHGECPALIANTNKTKAEWNLIDTAEAVTGIKRDSLFQGGNGMKDWNGYIELICKLL